MKQKLLLITLLCCGFTYNTVKANESEPNNTRSQANTLTLNGSNSGAINPTTDVDWFKVTTNGDGKLTLTLTVSNSLYCWFAIYDNDGTTLLKQAYTSSTGSYDVDGLATGTYYIKIYPYAAGQSPSYTISNTLTKPAQANDAEPDSTRATALTLALNGNATGHIGYYYKNHRDSVDEYKVTTNGDGALNVALSVANNTYVWFELDDNDGNILLQRNYTSGDGNYTVDGLAAGTYYIKIYNYNSNQFAPYTISNTLTKPTQANDVEPDSTKAQALTLPLNGSKTGHIGYYYKNHRDSVDEYKVTTDADGALTLALSVPNNTYVWFELDDNDGITLLQHAYTSSDGNYTVDGLAAGTYYIKIFNYNNTQFAPYKLTNTLTIPAEANDAEPDSTRGQAVNLTPNTAKTGHIGYYYKNHRDTVDVYNITTSADGNLNLHLTIPNNTYVWFALYDNNGTTVLYQAYTANSGSYNVDGLAKGTYYLKIFNYNSAQFAPYTIADTLTTYNSNDKEPNQYAKQAPTLLTKITNGGHVGFYYDNKKDSIDWQKINYTGPNNGSMTITFKLLPHVSNGALNYTWIQIYRDTAAAAIFNNYFINSSNTITLNSLTQGYYYVKVFMYNVTQFQAYSINPSFTQKKIAGIKIISYDTVATCVNYIKYQPNNSAGPTTVQLYRFGLAYGGKHTVQKGGTIKLDSLPGGSYYATVYADGATGNAYGTSDTIVLEPVPTNLTATNITNNKAVLNWSAEDCAQYFTVRYRKQGTTTWTTKATVGNVNNYKALNLSANTTYEWEVATADSANGIVVNSAFSTIATFTTSAALVAEAGNSENNMSVNGGINHGITVSPNPAASFFIIHYNSNMQNKVNASVYNANGKVIWSSGLINASTLNGKQVNASQFANGVFYLKIINEQGELIGSTKVIIAN